MNFPDSLVDGREPSLNVVVTPATQTPESVRFIVPWVGSRSIVAMVDFESAVCSAALTFFTAISQDSDTFGEPLRVLELLVIGSLRFNRPKGHGFDAGLDEGMSRAELARGLGLDSSAQLSCS